jgi:hypothetical protein
LRGVGAELDGGLEGGPAEVREQVPHLLLAGVDDVTGGGGVDGISDVLAEALEADPQLIQQGVGGEGRLRRRGWLGRHGQILCAK